MLRWTVPLLAVLAVLVAPSALAAGKAAHPDVGPKEAADACESCHAQATPETLKRWEAGRHGLLLVKCFACHGSTEKDFARRPAAARCAGCHPDEVASVAPARAAGKKGADCFPCHDPHTLAATEGAASPHGAR